MKKLAILLGAATFLTACEKPAGKTFELSVRLDGLGEGEKVYLYRPDTVSPQPKPVDSLAYTAKGLVFEGRLDQPYPYYIVFEKHPGAVEVFLDEGEVSVSGSVDNIPGVNVEGSAIHLTYQEAINGLKEIDKKERALYQRYAAAGEKKNMVEQAVLE
ncbi:MAG TPA: DUF4369 domain-containing protein, partial [Anseongella sp.]|nr:DUF4369 domain-containing protein [Anseongella sp.]